MLSFLEHLAESECRTPVEKSYYKSYRHLHLCKGQKGKSSSSKGGPASDAGADAGGGSGDGGDGGGV